MSSTIFTDFQRHSPTAAFSNEISCTVLQQLTRKNYFRLGQATSSTNKHSGPENHFALRLDDDHGTGCIIIYRIQKNCLRAVWLLMQHLLSCHQYPIMNEYQKHYTETLNTNRYIQIISFIKTTNHTKYIGISTSSGDNLTTKITYVLYDPKNGPSILCTVYCKTPLA